MPAGEVVRASAVYRRATDLSGTRLDQTYRRASGRCWRTIRPVIVDYPGIAVRSA
jgi:hypothetical protein